MDKLTKKQQSIVEGKEFASADFTRNEDCSITFEKGLLTYEEFHEALNHLFTSQKITSISGRNEDFVLIKRKIKIRI